LPRTMPSPPGRAKTRKWTCHGPDG
jgi:hypothetical protein